MKVLALFLSVFSSTILVAGEKPYAPENMPGATNVSAEETIEMILVNPELVVIDSRKKTEYVKGRIEGAINILNTELKLENLESVAPDKSTPTTRTLGRKQLQQALDDFRLLLSGLKTTRK